MQQPSMLIQLVTKSERAEALDMQTRVLASDLRQVEGVTAAIPEMPAVPGSRGDPITIGTIALAFVTGGGVTAVIQALIEWLKRGENRKVLLKVTIDENSFEAEFPSQGATQEEMLKFASEIKQVLTGKNKKKG